MDAIGCYFLNNLVLCLYAQRKNDNVLLLKERERMLFISLYGLDETDTRNHTEMAEELGLCKERIRQLEVKVFKKFYLLQRRKYVPVMRIYNLLTNQGHYSRSGETDHIRFLMEFREIHLPEWEIYLFLRFVKLFLRLEGSERKWINLIKRHHPGEMLQERGWKPFCPKLSGRSKSRCFQNLIIATLLQSACIIRK